MQTTNCNLLTHFPEQKTLFVCLFMFVCLFVCSVIFSDTRILNLQVVYVHQELE